MRAAGGAARTSSPELSGVVEKTPVVLTELAPEDLVVNQEMMFWAGRVFVVSTLKEERRQSYTVTHHYSVILAATGLIWDINLTMMTTNRSKNFRINHLTVLKIYF